VGYLASNSKMNVNGSCKRNWNEEAMAYYNILSHQWPRDIKECHDSRSQGRESNPNPPDTNTANIRFNHHPSYVQYQKRNMRTDRRMTVRHRGRQHHTQLPGAFNCLLGSELIRWYRSFGSRDILLFPARTLRSHYTHTTCSIAETTRNVRGSC
jgi:hypothetical protein